MKTDLKIKTESLPTRCEICHQSDLFYPQNGYCERCKGTTIIAKTDHILEPESSLREKFLILAISIVIGAFVGGSLASILYLMAWPAHIKKWDYQDRNLFDGIIFSAKIGSGLGASLFLLLGFRIIGGIICQVCFCLFAGLLTSYLIGAISTVLGEPFINFATIFLGVAAFCLIGLAMDVEKIEGKSKIKKKEL